MRVLGFSNSSATTVSFECVRRARGGLQLVGAAQQREQVVARQFGAGEEVSRQAREDSGHADPHMEPLPRARRPRPPAPARRGVRDAAERVGVGCRAAAGGAAMVAASARRRVWSTGVHGAHLAQPGAAARARVRGAPPGHREVLGRRSERDPRARARRNHRTRGCGCGCGPSAASSTPSAATTVCGSPTCTRARTTGRRHRSTSRARRRRCAAGRATNRSSSAAT